MVHHAIKRYGSPPAAVPRRATRRIATRQLPQAYPPQRGIGNRGNQRQCEDSFAGGCEDRGSAPVPPRFVALGPPAEGWGDRLRQCPEMATRKKAVGVRGRRPCRLAPPMALGLRLRRALSSTAARTSYPMPVRLSQFANHPMLAAPKAENLGGAGAEPLPSHPPAQPSMCVGSRKPCSDPARSHSKPSHAASRHPPDPPSLPAATRDWQTGGLPPLRPHEGWAIEQKRKVVQHISAQDAVPAVDEQELAAKGFAEEKQFSGDCRRGAL